VHCTVNCTVQYSTVQYCPVLYCTAPYSAMLTFLYGLLLLMACSCDWRGPEAWPPYSSWLAFELWGTHDNSQHFVRVVYNGRELPLPNSVPPGPLRVLGRRRAVAALARCTSATQWGLLELPAPAWQGPKKLLGQVPGQAETRRSCARLSTFVPRGVGQDLAPRVRGQLQGAPLQPLVGLVR